ncbi:hypothetical protein [Amycolatopsis nigrescens]|uniref:hypothetical protein n=1 Tax=Amycolatopsis nigrescens TaxID=381445 RepID=UPI00037B38AB|nr:hypothetical protein [Amycolatopsis nigrescens]
MRKLFDPVTGIGLSFIRNPMGASDLPRFSYSYNDLPAGQTDPGLARFSIAHDLADVLPLTKPDQVRPPRRHPDHPARENVGHLSPSPAHQHRK